MLRHIVLFAFDGFDSVEQKREHLQGIKKSLEGLVGELEDLRSLKVSLNVNAEEAYDLMLEAEVEDLDALGRYSLAEAHQRIVRELIRPYLKSRACVDVSLG